MRQRLVVYRQDLLPYSETFVLNQTRSFEALEPVLLGLGRASGLAIDVPHEFAFGPGRKSSIDVALFKTTRRHRRVRAALTRLSPVGVLAHFAQDGLRILPSASALGIPVAVFAHGTDVLMHDECARRQGFSGRQLAGGWGELTAGVRHFFASSLHVAQRLLERGVPEEKVSVHYVGIPVGGPPSLEPTSNFDVVFVGRLVENKGVAYLIRAAAKLARGTARIRIIGEGPDRASLENLAAGLGLLGTSVIFEGAKTPPEVRAAMQECAVVCVPSVTVASGASEGLGLVALEAQERMRPVVAFDTGGLREAVVHKETGLLVTPGSVDGLAAAIHDLVTQPARCRAMGTAGRARVVRKFDVRTRTQLLERDLLRVLRGES